MTCIVVSDTHARGRNHLECNATTTKERCHVEPGRQVHRRVQARDRRLRHIDGKAHIGMLQGTGPQLQDGQPMGDKAPARALRRARPQGRGPRAARGQKAHPRARDGEHVFEKKSRPSSPKTRRSRALPPHAGGEGRIPREADGPRARREPLGLLLVARERLPGGRLGRRARRRHARVAGIGPQVRLPVRARDAAAGVLAPDALQGC